MDILALLKFDIEEKIVMVNYMKIYGISRRIVGGAFWHSAGENYSTVDTLFFFSNLCLVWIITYFLCNLMYLFQF
jgi:hypothetical protein